MLIPRSDNQKLKMLYLLNYLSENTDENHVVNATKIIDDLEKIYGVSVSRNTVYTDIQMLNKYGEEYDIYIEYDRELKGYRVLNRSFELYEIRLLVDSLQSSKFITEKKAKQISEKLRKFVSIHSRGILNRQNYVSNRIKNMNDSVFHHIDTIHNCISKKKLIFKYFTYNVKKEKEYRKKTYIVSPFACIWNDNNYYLYAYENKKFKHFRIDKMDNIQELDEEIEGKEEFDKMNLSDRTIKVFSMFGGKEERVKMCFSNHLTGVVIDRFSKDVIMIPKDKEHFTINVAIEVSPQFFGWLIGLGRGVKIISPDSVIEKFNKHISKVLEMYQSDTNT